MVVFGDSEKGSGINKEDVNFLKDFASVKICFEKNLHAIFYASENGCLITSLNLHDYLKNTNIETGIYAEAKGALSKIATNLAQQITDNTDFGETATNFYAAIIAHSEVLYKKTAAFDNGILGFNKKYTGSTVEKDKLQAFFDAATPVAAIEPSIAESGVTEEKPVQETEPVRNSSFGTYVQKPAQPVQQSGYCIRTGVEVPFNPSKPYSDDAYKDWLNYRNWDSPENYCHKTGKQSFGKTSMRVPVL